MKLPEHGADDARGGESLGDCRAETSSLSNTA